MSDSVKKYHEMIEDGEIIRTGGQLYRSNKAKYIWLLDFEDGRVYRYNIGNIKTLMSMGFENHSWNPDHEA